MMAANIFNISLGQIDEEFDNDTSSFLGKGRQSTVKSEHEDDSDLFAFDDWLENRR